MSTTPLKALVVDDEQDARDLLKYYLSNIPEIGEIEEATNADEAILKYVETNPDLVFLDVMMPGKTGVELIEILKRKEPDCQIIIISAHRDSAVSAIQNSVYDFILKPIDFNLLQEKVEAFAHAREASAAEKIKKFINLVDTASKIKISSLNSYILVDPAELLYCEADGSYTYLYMENGTRELANTYLGKIATMLPANRFFRISRSTVINLEKLTHVDKTENTCVLKGHATEVKLTGTHRQIRILCEMDMN